MRWFRKDKEPCQEYGHWWGPDFIWRMEGLHEDGQAVRETYRTRDCQRCGVRDKVLINAEALGPLKLSVVR